MKNKNIIVFLIMIILLVISDNADALVAIDKRCIFSFKKLAEGVGAADVRGLGIYIAARGLV